MDLKDGRRIDYVNDSLSLIQDNEGLTFGTDALLLAGYVATGYKNALELGAGTGIISMLLLTREKCRAVTALEVQAEFCEIIRQNAELNNLCDKLTVKNLDLRELVADGEYDCVFTNPPYMRFGSGKTNASSKKAIARHELFGDIFDFVKCAARALKYGGSFYAVYRADRMADLIYAMRFNAIEPKRLTVVYADTKSAPMIILVEGKRGGKPGLKLTRPLIIYEDNGHKLYTPDMNYIMENGKFADGFGVENGKR